jgi:flagella basal body P-ring formation protein FlgA
MNPQHLTKKQVRILVALTILAWATQTLLHEWGYGQEIPPTPAQLSAESFVPQSTLGAGAGTLELRADTTVIGSDIKLKQICRWSDNDANAFTPVADLVIAHVTDGRARKLISMDELQKTLSDAQVNIAVIRFMGATTCTVTRGDISGGDRAALQQWLDESKPADDKKPGASPATQPADPAAPGAVVQATPIKTLHDKLLLDLSQRFNVPLDNLQVNFDPKDANLLNLAEPTFQFDIQPKRVRDLGEVSWNIGVINGQSQQKVSVTAEVRAWQDQTVVTRPVGYKSILQDEDITQRRVLIEQLDDVPVLTKEQVIGQAASRDLQPGMVMTARLVEAVPLVKSGEYVTVTLNQGCVEVKTVAKAMESGAFGQSIHVRNEETKDVYDVTMTGPQTATMGPATVAVTR